MGRADTESAQFNLCLLQKSGWTKKQGGKPVQQRAGNGGGLESERAYDIPP